MAENIAERIFFLTKQFPNVVELGAGKGHVLPKIFQAAEEYNSMVGNATNAIPVGIQNYTLCDGSEKLLQMNASYDAQCMIFLFSFTPMQIQST